MSKELQSLIAWAKAEEAKATQEAIRENRMGNTMLANMLTERSVAFASMVKKAELLLLAQKPKEDIEPPLQQAGVSGSLPPNERKEVAEHIREHGLDYGSFISLSDYEACISAVFEYSLKFRRQ